MTSFREAFVHFNELFTLYCVFPSILLLGVYLTWQLRFVQFSKLKMSLSLLFKQGDKGEGSISRYQAVASVLAANFGTGNISGMAVALLVGGPGALVWMWVMTCFGSVIQYASCLLGVKYRQKNQKGEFVGGPMYYLSHGLGLKTLGSLFACLVICAAFSVGNFVQVNSIALPLMEFGIPAWISGVVLAFFIGLVVIGGATRFARISAAIVPIMAFLYLGAAFIILIQHHEKILPALNLIVHSAFTFSTFVGGALGFTVMKALTTGFDRAIFATDAGTGTVPILQSSAKTEHPVMDGVVALLPPFLVMIVCTTTALVILVMGGLDQADLKSTNLVSYAFQKGIGPFWGTAVVITSLILFGYTTTLAWATCMERAVEFLLGRRFLSLFHYFYILMVPVGALLHVDFVWILADICLTSMMVLNLIGVMGLSKEVIGESKNYFLIKATS